MKTIILLFLSLVLNLPIIGSVLVPVDSSNADVFNRLCQVHEAEFSVVTGKVPNMDGTFDVEYSWKAPFNAFLLVENKKPVGFVVKDTLEGISDVTSFFIIPSCRGRGLGKRMAYEIFDRYPGMWQVRQLAGADKFKLFWRRVIKDYTIGNYSEGDIIDPYWGFITLQSFVSRG